MNFSLALSLFELLLSFLFTGPVELMEQVLTFLHVKCVSLYTTKQSARGHIASVEVRAVMETMFLPFSFFPVFPHLLKAL